MTTPTENLTLFETARLIHQELQTTNRLIVQMLQGQANMTSQLSDLNYTLNGFTSGGASLSGYLIDPMTMAYLAVLGPTLAEKLKTQEVDLTELIKGGTLLARQLLEELAAYRAERSAADYVEEQMELLSYPWSKQQGQGA